MAIRIMPRASPTIGRGAFTRVPSATPACCAGGKRSRKRAEPMLHAGSGHSLENLRGLAVPNLRFEAITGPGLRCPRGLYTYGC
jgi:hypothetical protein